MKSIVSIELPNQQGGKYNRNKFEPRWQNMDKFLKFQIIQKVIKRIDSKTWEAH